MKKCSCGCELEVTQERAVMIRCPNCAFIVIAPDLKMAEKMLAAKIKEKQNGDKNNRAGSAAAPASEEA